MQIIVYENSVRAQHLADILKNSELVSRYNKVYILPIPSSKDGLKINKSDITLESFTEGLSGGELVVGYGLSKAVRESILSKGAELCDSALDEAFLSENAVLTAEATLGILASQGKHAFSDMRVGVIGYGRIGRALVSRLLYLGAFVEVYTGREDVIIELASMGVSAKGYDGFADSNFDALVNTAPSDLFRRLSGEALFSSGVRIIELASGDNFCDAASSRLNIEKYPSLPSRAFPESAGKAWWRSVERFLLDAGENGGFAYE